MKILVTGGASGLGKSITLKLLKVGHEVIVTHRSSIDSSNKILGVKYFHCDFSSVESIQDFCSILPNLEFEALVNNAHPPIVKQHFHKLSNSEVNSSFETSVIPVLKITQQAIKLFRKNKFGKIITILSSSIINKPPIGWSTYVANKAYLLSMSKSWASENIKKNITSNTISPGFMKTNFNKDVDERMIENMLKNHPLKSLLKIEEIADVVSFFINSTQQINGTNFIVNAGKNII